MGLEWPRTKFGPLHYVGVFVSPGFFPVPFILDKGFTLCVVVYIWLCRT